MPPTEHSTYTTGIFLLFFMAYYLNLSDDGQTQTQKKMKMKKMGKEKRGKICMIAESEEILLRRKFVNTLARI